MSSRARRAYTKRLKRIRQDAEWRAEHAGKEKVGYIGVPVIADTGDCHKQYPHLPTLAIVRPVTQVNPDTIRVRRAGIGTVNPGIKTRTNADGTAVPKAVSSTLRVITTDGVSFPGRHYPMVCKVRMTAKGWRQFRRFCSHHQIAYEQLDDDIFACHLDNGSAIAEQLATHPSVIHWHWQLDGDKEMRAQGQMPKK